MITKEHVAVTGYSFTENKLYSETPKCLIHLTREKKYLVDSTFILGAVVQCTLTFQFDEKPSFQQVEEAVLTHLNFTLGFVRGMPKHTP
ncbi:MAG: hypothetical protein HRT61_23135 [Ekhidna sp.]|nr:hypothetical protein [Ekhidna sp.]